MQKELINLNRDLGPTKEENGFILLEAIIAVGVLVTIFAATIALYVSSVGGLRISNDQLVATYLAQDGMEQVIARRQYNYDNDLGWLDGLSQCTSGNPCSANYFEQAINIALPACVSGCALYIDANGEYSSDSGGSLSHYKRKVEISSSGAEAHVVVRVSWADGANTLEVPVSYTLYDDPN